MDSDAIHAEWAAAFGNEVSASNHAPSLTPTSGHAHSIVSDEEIFSQIYHALLHAPNNPSLSETLLRYTFPHMC